MELLTKKIRHLAVGIPVGDQMQIDDDYNVPDSKPDVAAIVHSVGKIRVEEAKRTENHMCLRGRLQFNILYLTDDEEKRFQSLEGNLPFEENVYIGERKEAFYVKQPRMDFNVSVIHSRKISIRALVDFELSAETDTEEELPYDMEGMEKVCMKKSQRRLLHLHTDKKDQFRIKEEVELPGTKENIGNILWKEISLQGVEQRLEEGLLLMRGNIQVFCLYQSEENRMDWVEKSQPFEGKIECDGADTDLFPHVTYTLADADLETRMDEDGELRILGVEGTVELRIQIYKEEEETILEDLYIPGCHTKVKQEERIFDELLLRNHARCKVNERIQLPELKDEILQICHSSGEMHVEHTQMETDGLHVEGILELVFLYIRSDDRMPLGVWKGDVPFLTVLEVPDGGGQPIYDLSVSPEQIAVGLLGGEEVEVKASAALECFFLKRNVMQMIADISWEEMTQEEKDAVPGITGCMVCRGDTLWNIAKKYQTTTESIMEANHLQEETVKPGDKLLIFKETSCILNV